MIIIGADYHPGFQQIAVELAETTQSANRCHPRQEFQYARRPENFGLDRPREPRLGPPNPVSVEVADVSRASPRVQPRLSPRTEPSLPGRGGDWPTVEGHAALPARRGQANAGGAARTSQDVVAVAAFSGLRRGEIEGLEWEYILPDAIRVECSIWNGKAYDAKTEASKGLVPLIPALRVILEAHRLRSGNPTTGPLFPTCNGTPISMNNLLNDKLLPALRRCAHCQKPFDKPHLGHVYQRDESRPDWKGWHAFRRGLATNLHDLGVDDFTIQRILRHSSVEVTRRAYIRTLPEQSIDAMGRLENKLSSMIQ
jgi:integrase